MVTEGDLTLHGTLDTDDVLQNYILETYIILLTNVTPRDSVKFKEKLSLGIVPHLLPQRKTGMVDQWVEFNALRHSEGLCIITSG